MAAKSYTKGHSCEWDGMKWIYSDTKELIADERPCKKCGNRSTDEGYDHCIGYIKGAKSACCGHGVEEGFVLYEDGRHEEI